MHVKRLCEFVKTAPLENLHHFYLCILAFHALQCIVQLKVVWYKINVLNSQYFHKYA